MAERLGAPGLQAAALFTLHSLGYAPGNPDERLELATQQVQLARQAGDLHWELWGSLGRQMALLQRGDIAAFRVELEEYGRRAQEARLQVEISLLAAGRAALATAEGRFDDAEALIFESLKRGLEAGSADARTTFGAQLYILRWLQGRIGDVETMFREAAEASPNVAVYGAGLALVFSELGRLDEAGEQLDLLAVHDFSDIPQDFLWMVTMSVLAVVCHSLGERRHAATLYSLCLPYAGLNATVVHVLSGGATSHFLALLATVLGRWEDAESHFQRALELNAHMEHWPWLAMTRLGYATMLYRRAGHGDVQKARALLREALAAAEAMGMAKVAADCRALLSS